MLLYLFNIHLNICNYFIYCGVQYLKILGATTSGCVNNIVPIDLLKTITIRKNNSEKF